MINIQGLTLYFNNNCILNNLNLTINPHDIIAIIGSSGAGKSSFLRCLNLLEKPQTGVIQIGDQTIDTCHLKKNDIVKFRQQTAMVFQQFNLFSQKNALENVMEGLIVVKKYSREAATRLAIQKLTQVGLAERMYYYPKQLSGGQQQRVAIARALAMEPQVLLLDEPISALDPELVDEVLATIRQVAKNGNTMILVSHEMSFVREVATRVLFLDKGHIIEDSSPDELFNNPKHERTKQFLSRYYTSLEPDYLI